VRSQIMEATYWCHRKRGDDGLHMLVARSSWVHARANSSCLIHQAQGRQCLFVMCVMRPFHLSTTPADQQWWPDFLWDAATPRRGES
jgi:hypothetical protein